MPAPFGRYGRTAIILHWAVAFLISATVVLAWVVPRRYAPGHDVILELHKSVGMVVLVLAALRLFWRFGNPVPPAQALTPVEARLSSLVHVLLYAVVMIGIPVTGYVFTSAEGHSLAFFGLGPLPSPLATDRAVSRPMEILHKAGQWAVYAVVGLHVLGALYHYFVKRDGVLQRMLPLGETRGAN